jgi:peroxidase
MYTKKLFLMAMSSSLLSIFFTNAFSQTSTADRIKLFTELPRSVTITPGPARTSSAANAVLPAVRSPYRSFDGLDNNISALARQVWGSANIRLFRELPAEYGPTNPNGAMGGTSRPSARAISNSVVDEPVTIFNARKLSAFVYIWGQFIDHDMTLTPTGTTESVPIPLPTGETIFTVPIPFTRSEVAAGTGVTTVREQLNLNTAWIDGSMVYGSDLNRSNWLRTFTNGKMKVSAGNLMPYNTTTGQFAAPIDPNAPRMANDNNLTVKTFAAGDVRASEHPGLISLHTLFVREHNRYCDTLFARGVRNDELMYQLARKRVGALIQSITYNEFLPNMGVTLSAYVAYNAAARPDILNTFATAGYRLGHTMVADEVLLFNNACGVVAPGVIELDSAFWNPKLVADHGIEPFLKGLAAHRQYETNTKINSLLRNFLFGNPGDPIRAGIDLGSLNIQRGRDHGLPDYNTVRTLYTGTTALSFSNITSDVTLRNKLAALYGNVNNVDLWIGVLAENLLPGKSVGLTVHAMLKSQFEKLRDGDYYFYLSDPGISVADKAQIKATTLSTLIKKNTLLTSLQANVFVRDSCPATPAIVNTGIIKQEEILPDAAGGFSVYPNPVSNLLHVRLNNVAAPGMIRIFTTDGVPVKTVNTVPGQKEIQVSTQDLKKGTYYIYLLNGKEEKPVKFLVL